MLTAARTLAAAAATTATATGVTSDASINWAQSNSLKRKRPNFPELSLGSSVAPSTTTVAATATTIPKTITKTKGVQKEGDGDDGDDDDDEHELEIKRKLRRVMLQKLEQQMQSTSSSPTDDNTRHQHQNQIFYQRALLKEAQTELRSAQQTLDELMEQNRQLMEALSNRRLVLAHPSQVMTHLACGCSSTDHTSHVCNNNSSSNNCSCYSSNNGSNDKDNDETNRDGNSDENDRLTGSRSSTPLPQSSSTSPHSSSKSSRRKDATTTTSSAVQVEPLRSSTTTANSNCTSSATNDKTSNNNNKNNNNHSHNNNNNNNGNDIVVSIAQVMLHHRTRPVRNELALDMWNMLLDTNGAGVSQLSHPVMVWDATNFNLIGCNYAFCTMSQFSESELRNQFSILNLVPKHTRTIWQMVLEWILRCDVRLVTSNVVAVLRDGVDRFFRMKQNAERSFVWVELECVDYMDDRYEIDHLVIPETYTVSYEQRHSVFYPMHQKASFQKFLDVLWQCKSHVMERDLNRQRTTKTIEILQKIMQAKPVLVERRETLKDSGRRRERKRKQQKAVVAVEEADEGGVRGRREGATVEKERRVTEAAAASTATCSTLSTGTVQQQQQPQQPSHSLPPSPSLPQQQQQLWEEMKSIVGSSSSSSPIDNDDLLDLIFNGGADLEGEDHDNNDDADDDDTEEIWNNEEFTDLLFN